mmetsp:Transcript_9991/g.17995  ORF Transcript_9991/g.17995 Transcript_9991/m.17995 type:complete len:153 (-) Transcript_9991:1105-1563(-)
MKPTFDARIVMYPRIEHIRDYIAWRQADVHINNQYNTCFWALVGSGVSKQAAQNTLRGTLSDFKNELLYSRFGINYNNLPEIFRKGSILYRLPKPDQASNPTKLEKHTLPKTCVECAPFCSIVRENLPRGVEICHEDVIRDTFWVCNPHLLE